MGNKTPHPPLPPHQPEYAQDAASLAGLARFFLWMGVTAFGGPAAHIAVLQREVVERRRWVTPAHFRDLLAVSSLLPGPTSTEMTMNIGFVQRGDAGIWVAGLCFILPAGAITLGLTWGYSTYGRLPEVTAILSGIFPVVVALIAAAVWQLARQTLDHVVSSAVALLALVASFLGVNELLVLAGGGIAGLAAFSPRRQQAAAVTPWWLAGPVLLAQQAPEPTMWQLWWQFLRFGATLFGSGYLLVAYLDRELVDRLGWLTPEQLVAAVAIGEITPGPLFTTSTAAGYLILGVPGALTATAAMFLPAFVLAHVVGRQLPRLLALSWVRPLLRGLTAAVVGVMAAVGIELAQQIIDSWATAAIVLVALGLLVFTRVSGLVLIPAGGLVGYTLSLLIG